MELPLRGRERGWRDAQALRAGPDGLSSSLGFVVRSWPSSPALLRSRLVLDSSEEVSRGALPSASGCGSDAPDWFRDDRGDAI